MTDKQTVKAWDTLRKFLLWGMDDATNPVVIEMYQEFLVVMSKIEVEVVK